MRRVASHRVAPNPLCFRILAHLAIANCISLFLYPLPPLPHWLTAVEPTDHPITFLHATGKSKPTLACAFIYQGPHSFHVNDTRAPAKASSELRPSHHSRRRCRKIIVHVASTPSGASDEGRRRHRTSGVFESAAAAEEEEGVQSHRRRSCQPEMSDHGCIHLNNFKAAKGIQPYKVIHSYFVTSTSTEGRVRKVRLFPPRVQFASMVIFRDNRSYPGNLAFRHVSLPPSPPFLSPSRSTSFHWSIFFLSDGA